MIQDFIEYLRYERNFSAHTAFAYMEDLSQLAEWLSEQGKSFEELSMTTDDVRGWIMWMVEDRYSYRGTCSFYCKLCI